MSSIDRMQDLIDSFPSLKSKGMSWSSDNSVGFVEQCHGLSSGERHAAAFVLYVWNRHEQPNGLRFDFDAAVTAWDKHHLEALRKWLSHPWYA